MRTMFGLILLLIAVTAISVILATPARSDHLERAELETCANRCIGEVLSGRRELTDCVSLTLATRQIVGPSARTKSDTDLLPIVAVVGEVLRERLDRYASEFVGAQIEVRSHQSSQRQQHVYGIDGWVRRPSGGDYEFSANGQFLSATECRLYTLAVGPISVNRWLREQPSVDRAIEEAIRVWSRQP